jgi:hypothetical protein
MGAEVFAVFDADGHFKACDGEPVRLRGGGRPRFGWPNRAPFFPEVRGVLQDERVRHPLHDEDITTGARRLSADDGDEALRLRAALRAAGDAGADNAYDRADEELQVFLEGAFQRGQRVKVSP